MDAVSLAGAAVPMGWSVRGVDFPAYDGEYALRCLDSCRQNLCGSYGTCWSCPPGWKMKLDSLGERFDSAILLERCFFVRPDDKEALERVSAESHGAIRSAVAAIRKAGHDAMGFSDGQCGYCGVCSYPEECRFPEQLVPSISATGTDLSAVLAGIGESFEFRDDRVTLYGLVLYRA